MVEHYNTLCPTFGGEGIFLFAYMKNLHYLCTARDREWLRLRLPVIFICIIQVNALPL